MPLILGKSKGLIPKETKVIKYVGHPEQKAIKLATEIAKSFGVQSKKMPRKKIILR